MIDVVMIEVMGIEIVAFVMRPAGIEHWIPERNVDRKPYGVVFSPPAMEPSAPQMPNLLLPLRTSPLVAES